MRISRRPVIKAFAGLVAFVPAVRALAATPTPGAQPEIPCDPCAYTYCGSDYTSCDRTRYNPGNKYTCHDCYDQCTNDYCITECTLVCTSCC